MEVVFNPFEKGFFSIGKQEKPSDYFEGNVYQVTPEFMKKFLAKKKQVSEKDIVKKYGKIHGIWNKQLMYED